MPGFSEKVTTFSPLTRRADAFSPHTFAAPDFRLGRLAVADFQVPTTQRLEGFGPSYTSGLQDSARDKLSNDREQ